MALTAEQQAEVDKQNATEDNRAANQAASEDSRAANQAASEARRAKLEMVRTAKEILVENRRTQAAADATDITASAVTALATDLTAFVNS